jgi:predicted transcriptional regulator
MNISIRQIKAARALLAWSQEDLAARSGVSYPTIARLETSDGELGGRADTATKIIESLEAAGIIFVAENGEGHGVRLKKKRK